MKTLIFLLAVFWSTNAFSQIVLSEIMFNPPGNDQYNEYVEIYNLSKQDSVDLTKWLLSDGERYNQILGLEQGTILAPQTFAIILPPKYYTESHFYDHRIPPGTLRLTISHATLGRNGFANSRAETISIYRPDTSLVASWTYRVPIADGYSEEKIILGRGDVTRNWAVSKIKEGTPGFLNSVTPLQYDLRIDDEIAISPESITSQDSLTISCIVENIGSEKADSAKVYFYLDRNNNGIPESEEVLNEDGLSIAALDWLDSTKISFTVHPLPAGDHTIIVVVHFSPDGDTSNNVTSCKVAIQIGRGDVVINEIYNNPKSGQGCWIEIYNQSSQTVDLKEWFLEFPYYHSKITLTSEHVFLPADSLVVFAQTPTVKSESWQTHSRIVILDSFPTLSPDYDAILLKNSSMKVMDFASYSKPGPREPGISLERLEGDSSSVWDYCPHPQGSTPGEHNALGRTFADVALDSFALSYEPEQPTFGEDIVITCRVHNWGELSSEAGNAFLQIINDVDSADTTILRQTLPRISPQDTLQINFLLSRASIGSYTFIVHIESKNDFYPINNQAREYCSVGYPPQAAVINEIMYDTEEKSQEWIEIYNRSTFTINIGKCWIKDSRKKVRICDYPVDLEPGNYVVISNMPIAMLGQHQNIVNASLPELNNSGDDVVLLDPSGAVIDSVHYTKYWGGSRSVSLERIRFEDSSLDSYNWATCTDSTGSTPGQKNSVSPGNYDVAVVPHSIEFDPTAPTDGETVVLKARVENFGREKLENISVVFTHSIMALIETIDEPIVINKLETRQKRTIKIEWRNISPGVHRVTVAVSHPNDNTSANNAIDTTIVVSYKPTTMVINEIMYNPAPSMPEWIEIFNKSDVPVQTDLWSLADSDTTRSIPFSDSSLIINPSDFLILSRDSIPGAVFKKNQAVIVVNKAFPSLNNDTDTIYLFDGNGRIIDRATYFDTWGGMKGRSLERVNPCVASSEKSNWMVCVSPQGHSAGGENSVFTRVLPQQATMSVNPDPFSPDGDGFEDVAAISYSLPERTAMVNVKIYDINGRIVRFLLNNEPSASQRTVFWDGLNDYGEPCRMGIYIIFLQALDSRRGVIQQTKKTIVLAHPL